ncbi:MAG TPA: O-antigen ligase family protein [Solirubrobacterales bacterium]|jgi:glycosyltransferase involved in cell wall biosynthesis/O-antigen ligase|nr:O-antigen ligase family protein [Solirubrobacterales bacterium]
MRRAITNPAASPFLLAALCLGVVAAVAPKLGVGLVVVCAYASLAVFGFVPMFAAWTLSFFIPFFTVGNALLKVGLAATVFSLLLAWFAGAPAIRARIRAGAPFLIVGAAFLAWLAATTIWAPDSGLALSQLWKYGISIGIFAALTVAVGSKGGVRLIAAAFVAGAALTALCGLFGINAGPVNSLPGQARVQGGAGDPNVLAAAVLAAAALAGGLLPGTRRPAARLLLLAAIAVFGLTLAGTESRGGAIAAITVLIAALLVMRRRRGAVLGLAIGGLLAAAAWFLASPSGFERLTNFNDHGNGRDELWRIAWEMFSSHPLQGVGLQNFVPQAPDYVLHPGALQFIHLIIEKPVVVHNVYLQFLAETGIVGLLLFLTLVTLSLVASLRAASIYEGLGDRAFADLCRCLFLAVVALLAAGFFISSGVDYKLWALLGLGPATLLLARRAGSGGVAVVGAPAPWDWQQAPAALAAAPAVRRRVAVVIPCFNDGATVGAAVESTYGQEPCEVVIVDDGSDDPATLRVLELLERAGTRVVRQENRGLSAARIRGVIETDAPYIQPLDADDMLAPGALRRLADVLDREPSLGMAWGDQRVFGEIELTQRRASTLDPWAITYSNRLTEGLIRRKALFDAGGWELSVGFEDWDLYMGLAECGWEGRRVDAVTYLYRIASSRMLSSARLQHDDLYRQMRERHPRLFAERGRNWRRSSAPLQMRLLLPLIARLPISGFQRHRIGLLVSEPGIALRVRLSRLKRRRARR